MYISTLRRYVEAMGGRLVISAQFTDGAVEVDQFTEVAGEHPRPDEDPYALGA